MPSRRFHGKTRTGCTSCKARHVKCGEERPICHHCQRRNTHCIYPEHVPGNNHTNPNVLHQPHASLPSTSPSSLRASSNDGLLHSPDAFDALDLTLMHRYATSTSTRLLLSADAQPFWQIEVPKMAEASAILQRGILALAAMDLACEAASSPDKNLALMAMYRSRSLRHQQTALPQFRSLLENPDHSHADGKTIFVFSIFLLFLAFASAHSAETKPTIDDILDLFALFRGPRMLWKIAQENADRVVIDGIFPNRMAETPNRDKTSEGRPYQSLRALPLDEAATQALDNLTESWKFSQLQPSDVRCMAWFPALVPDLFCAQIRQRQPHALAILSEYAGILRPFRGLWWVRSWDQVLDEAIQVVLREESIALPVCKKS